MSVATPWGSGDVATQVAGTFNASNVLGVLGVLLGSGIPLDEALAALARITAPPGRMQRLGGGFEPLVVVDYAHSPDALEKVLTALRPTVVDGGELICVFGCGGDRDAGKRPEMGRVAATLADRVVVTSDNPRSEDPAAIADAVVRGIRDAGRSRWTLELDRAAAIRTAIASARGGDVVLVAGKGHEDYQERDGVRTHFSDAEVAPPRCRVEQSARGCERRMMDTATAARARARPLLGGNVRFARVATDTRTLAPGDLFVAIKGERFDGHDFVGAAFERGAVAALVADDRAARARRQPGRRCRSAGGARAASPRTGARASRFPSSSSSAATARRRSRKCWRRSCARTSATPRARDAGQPQQRDRPAADAAAPARASTRRRRSSSA